MKTVDEVYKESIEAIDRAEAMTEIAGEIKTITEALHKVELRDWSADQLSRALTKLAVLRVNLGAEMADNMAYYDMSYLNRKLKYAGEWKPTKDKLSKTLKRATIQDIDAEILQKLAEDYQNEIKQKHFAERLSIMHKATETLITALQSRLSLLKIERREAYHG